MYILGIHPIGHDTSACILKDGKILFAIEEERLTKIKHSTDFPFKSIKACLNFANLSIKDIDVISLSGNYNIQAKKRYFEFWNKYFPKNKHRIINEIDNLKYNLNLENYIRQNLNFDKEIYQCHHHTAHFASAYFTSQFTQSSLFSIDGVGDFESCVSGYANKNQIKTLNECSVQYPISIGLVYTAITSYLGFIPHCDEGKVMGLAPYGKIDTYRKKFNEIFYFLENGKIDIDLDYFDFPYIRGSGVSEKFNSIFGPKRKKDQKINQRHKDIAAAIQHITEKVLIHGLNALFRKTKCKNLSLAGGVALNCVANGKIFSKTKFKNINIQPASGDNGTALGSALYRYFAFEKKFNLNLRPKNTAYYGTSYENKKIEKKLKQKSINFKIFDDASIETAKLLYKGKIIAWFNGKMEFGPRALGNRSILTAPFPAKMKNILNLRVKKRESFRPFAPSVLEEHSSNYFKDKHISPHMLLAWNVRKNKISKVPAITHIDNTARVQTVSKNDNEVYYNLIKSFYKISGIPILLNTSFNRMGQPICHDIEDAINTFFENDIDYLVLNNKYLVSRER